MRDMNDRLDEHLGRSPFPWERLIQTDDFARRAREYVKEILTVIHEHLPSQKTNFCVWNSSQKRKADWLILFAAG